MSKLCWVIGFLCLGCGTTKGEGADGGSGANAGGSGGSGASAGDSGASAGDSGASAGGSGANAGDSGASAGDSGANAGDSGASAGGIQGTPFDDLTVLPDSPTTPVADCANEPDLSLCSVVTTPDRSYDICVGGTCVSPGCGELDCNVPAPHFLIPPNTDHIYLQAVPGDEPVVIDLATGLYWQTCAAGTSDSNCATGDIASLDWDAALAYCDGLSWGGHDDWYVPDIYELASLLDVERTINTRSGLNPELFPRFDELPPLWSSHYAGNDYALGFSYIGKQVGGTESVVEYIRSEGRAVRCVRRGFSRNAQYGGERYQITTDGAGERVIEDPATGLVWQGCVNGRSGEACDGSAMELPGSQWMAYCSELMFAGFDDWRLATFKEYQSITAYPPLIGSAGIDQSIFDYFFDYLVFSTGWDDDPIDRLYDDDTAGVVGPNPSFTYPAYCVRWK